MALTPATWRTAALRLAALLIALAAAGAARADWPMPGHDPQRTSRSSDRVPIPARPIWHTKIDALIPSRSQIITVDAGSGHASTLLVTAADGIHALDPQTGAERWVYAMDMPPGDAPTAEGRVTYVPGTDGTIHAIQTGTGARIWQTARADAPFYANPIAAFGRVCAGARDGVFYCFDRANGELLWFKRVEAPIAYGAAFATYPDEPNGVYYFASQDRCAYALRGDTGEEIWRSCDLPGSTFIAYWPVITGDRVLFTSAANYPTDDHYDLGALQREELLPEREELLSNRDQLGRLKVDQHIAWLEQHPGRRSIIVLDRKTGADAETAPFLWWGNPGGQRFPPAVDGDGLVWALSPWLKTWFGQGRYLGWRIGETAARMVPETEAFWESADEPESYSIINGDIYFNSGGDGGDFGGVFAPDRAASWAINVFFSAFGDYWGRWDERKYGNRLSIREPTNPFNNAVGWHGHQNPPVPLGDKVYFHRSNAVICMGR